jgi:hypothetical protein
MRSAGRSRRMNTAGRSRLMGVADRSDSLASGSTSPGELL